MWGFEIVYRGVAAAPAVRLFKAKQELGNERKKCRVGTAHRFLSDLVLEPE